MLSPALCEARFVVVDLETTGASAVYDRVTEVAAVPVGGGRIGQAFAPLVDPGVPIPPFITRLTGITDRMVAGRPRLEAVLSELRAAFEGRVFVAHNASFDYAFLKQSFARAGYGRATHASPLPSERLCTMRLARRLLPGLRSYRLEALLERFRTGRAFTCSETARARCSTSASRAMCGRGSATTCGATAPASHGCASGCA